MKRFYDRGMRVRQQLYIGAVSYWLVVWAAFSATYICSSGDGPVPEFYGFPFVSHSGNSNHHTSLFGYVFPAGFVLNMLVWVVVLNGVAVLARRWTRLVDALWPNSQTSIDVLRWLAVVTTSMLVGLRFLLADVLLLDWEMRDGLHSFMDYEPVFNRSCVGDRSFQFLGDVGVAQGVFLAVVFLALSEPREPSAPDGSVERLRLHGAGGRRKRATPNAT